MKTEIRVAAQIIQRRSGCRSALLVVGRMLDMDRGEQPELHCLLGQREGAADDRLCRDHGGGGGEDDQ